ncbi:ABC transporter permease [Nocardioides sp. W7]|uniref:ABC transporter permease n=1 Tax=Nocardioides sp. W7 TaxID=2931390 RepID=UPI001FD17BDD|nr:ABC transporter permease [Nocardioides sp. W7]
MMLAISRRTVRRSWPAYVGAFVALACGVVLIGMAVTITGAVEQTLGAPGVTAAERVELDDLAALIGIMSAVALFMALFVVASTFGFVVATRQRELGLLRLVGATPRQVRRMVLGESAVVALLASAAGALLSTLLAPAFLALLRARGVTTLDLELPAPWLAWSIAVPCGAAVALAGSWRASKRAASVAPSAALREASLERRRPSVTQLVVGTTFLLGSLAVLPLAGRVSPLFALVAAVLLPEVVVIGLVCFGRVLFPWLGGLLAAPFARRDVSARLARDHVRTASRAPAALAAPILAISAIAGSLIVTLSFTADWTTALNREQLHASVVVETGGDPAAVERLRAAGVDVADERTTLPVLLGADASRENVDVVDVGSAEQARGLVAVRGSLARLDRGHLAISETFAMDQGRQVGDRMRVQIGERVLRPRVGAVVRDAPDLYGEVLLPRVLVGSRAGTVETVFVVPGAVDVASVLAGTDAEVLSARTWIERTDEQARAGNAVGLWVLLGPSGLYAGIAIVNSVLIAGSQRRAQLRAASLLGATVHQLRRAALWEAGVVGAAALLVGGAVVAFVGAVVRASIARDVGDVGFTLPWLPLLAIAVTCGGLALLAALAGSAQSVRALRRAA